MEPDETALGDGVAETLPESSTPPLRMNAAEPAAADVFSNHGRLVEWVLENDGHLHSQAQIAFSTSKGYHVVVADAAYPVNDTIPNDNIQTGTNGNGTNQNHQIALGTLQSGTRIASTPMSVTLSVLNALDIAPFASHGTVFPKTFLQTQSKTPQSLQAFFLMEQMILDGESWWAPYVAVLPSVEDVTAMQFEEEADIMWLDGTNLKGGLAMQTAKWKEMYLQGSGKLRHLGWANALNGSYTWPRFRWAATMFNSRAFTSQVLDATLPADQARIKYGRKSNDPYDLVTLFADRFAVLLPLLDLLNHRPGAKVEWQARYNFIGLQILEPYETDQELCNNYGPRDNEGLLLAYGFTIENNPFDHLVISLKVPPGSPLDIARRTWKLDLRSDPEKRCFIFDHKHPESTSAVALETSLFSFDLLDSISILCANEREMQSMMARNQSLMSSCLGKQPKFEDGRIILATLSQLLRECTVRVERLRSTDPSRITAGLEPANSKQRNAKIYRDSQLAIVETAVALCTFVLKCAASGIMSNQQMLQSLQGNVSENAFRNLETLTDRHSQLTHPLELLDFDKLVEMVPNTDRLRRCLSELEQILLGQANAGLETTPIADFSKSRLAVALSALYSEYAHGVKLPHRVTEWMKQLVSWYPPDPDSWAYVPTPGPWAPGEEPPPELMSLLSARAAMSPTMVTDSAVKRWLRPDRICWGWNVMEEEKVMVPTRVIGPDVIGDASDGSSILVYWQRY